ncbi:hypothetical protein, partial [Rathayibacter tritici]|uniref:hypothetical protein n=1 Tax=Rathayibacter tritici TaxID=33888 RepID=UPI001CA56F97
YFPRELDIPGLPFGHRGNPTNSAVVQKEWGTSTRASRRSQLLSGSHPLATRNPGEFSDIFLP